MQPNRRKLILNTQTFERASLAGLCNNIRNSAAKAVDDIVILNGNNAAGVNNRLFNCLAVNRLERMHVQHADFQAIIDLKCLSRLERLIDAGATGNDRQVRTVVKHMGLAQLETILRVLIQEPVKAAVDADVKRAGGLICRADGVDRLHAVCGADELHIRQRAQQAKINNRMVGGTRLTKRCARMGTDDFYICVLIADIRVQLIGHAHSRKHGHCGDKWNKPCLSHAGCDTDHVLLRNTNVKEAVRELLPEYADFSRTAEICRQGNDIGVLFCKLTKRLSVVLGCCHSIGANRRINQSSCHD